MAMDYIVRATIVITNRSTRTSDVVKFETVFYVIVYSCECCGSIGDSACPGNKI